MTSQPDLAGRHVIVIGAEMPAGGAIAKACAAAGADIAICALTADEAVMTARRVRRAVEALGRRAPEYVMDVTLGKNVQVTMRQVVKELGGVDLVVVAPDLYLAAPIAKTTDTDLQRVMQVNFSAHVFAVRHAADEFRRAGHPGRILCVTGGSGSPEAAAAAYDAAQGAVHRFVRAAAVELAPDAIEVVGIALRAGWATEEIEALAVRLATGQAGVASGDVVPLGPEPG